MEKFGIFELLDALSALTAQDKPQEEVKPSAKDAAYQPPVYSAGESAAKEPHNTSAQGAQDKDVHPHAESDALADFYARHNAVAKKAGKK